MMSQNHSYEASIRLDTLINLLYKLVSSGTWKDINKILEIRTKV